jgi:hypothetical protein
MCLLLRRCIPMRTSVCCTLCKRFAWVKWRLSFPAPLAIFLSSCFDCCWLRMFQKLMSFKPSNFDLRFVIRLTIYFLMAFFSGQVGGVWRDWLDMIKSSDFSDEGHVYIFGWRQFLQTGKLHSIRLNYNFIIGK